MSALPCNVGGIDRVIRAAVGIVLLALVALGAATGTLAWVAGVVGVVMLGTAALKFCPLYPLIGMKTCAD